MAAQLGGHRQQSTVFAVLFAFFKHLIFLYFYKKIKTPSGLLSRLIHIVDNSGGMFLQQPVYNPHSDHRSYSDQE
ncbi:hypothetical protein [Comamonas sp. JUb58]|uniref:hypothetical protein n=1 Tax=Comamonas sp. JUb58 TaxID=2485114 RepID=UPI00105D9440|nr:hypothetical protein [Comamonas sp. JUb58]